MSSDAKLRDEFNKFSRQIDAWDRSMCKYFLINAEWEAATCYLKKKEKKKKKMERETEFEWGKKNTDGFQVMLIIESCLQWIQWNATLFSVDSNSPFLCSFKVKCRKKLKPQRKPMRDGRKMLRNKGRKKKQRVLFKSEIKLISW